MEPQPDAPSIETVIEAAREFVCGCRLSRAEVARRAELHPNTLLDVAKPTWRPSTETLRRLEQLRLRLADGAEERAA